MSFINSQLESFENSLWYEYLMMIVMPHICYLGLMWMFVATKESVYIYYPLVSLLLFILGADVFKYHRVSLALLTLCIFWWWFYIPAIPTGIELPDIIQITIHSVFYGIYLFMFTFYEIVRYARRGQ